MPHGNTESIQRFSSPSTHVLFEELLRLKVVEALGTLMVNSSYLIQLMPFHPCFDFQYVVFHAYLLLDYPFCTSFDLSLLVHNYWC